MNNVVRLEGDVRLIKIAREIAIEHQELDIIFQRYNITQDEWQNLQNNPRFIQVLRQEIEEWHGATNTHERVKLKAAALIEEWLLEASARLHDQNENLPAKVELAKFLGRLSGMGIQGANIEGGGAEKFSLTINIGDKSVKVERDVTPRVIEGEAA